MVSICLNCQISCFDSKFYRWTIQFKRKSHQEIPDGCIVKNELILIVANWSIKKDKFQ